MKSNDLFSIYNKAYNFLLQQNGITDVIINKHLESESFKPDNLKIIYQRFCESAQNRQMSNKVIGHSIGGVQNLSKVLYDFDPVKVVNKYLKNENLKLLRDIEKILKPTGQIRVTSNSFI